MSVKITKVTLYRTRLTNNNVVLDRSGHAEMLATCDKIEVENCTFQRDTRIFRAPLSMDVAGRYNYIQYNNESQDFFGFITQMTYVNDNMTAVYWEPDYWSTWQGFLYTNRPCYVERQIVAKEDDKLGRYTQDESVGVSDYQMNEDSMVHRIYGANYEWAVMLCMGKSEKNRTYFQGETFGTLGKYYGAYTALYYLMPSGVTSLNSELESLNEDLADSSNLSIQMQPYLNEDTDETYNRQYDRFFEEYDLSVNLDVKNMKCYTYPFCRFVLSTSDGEKQIFKPEMIVDGSLDNLDYLQIKVSDYRVKHPTFGELVFPSYYGGYDNRARIGAVSLTNMPNCAIGSITGVTNQTYTKALASATMGALGIASGGLKRGIMGAMTEINTGTALGQALDTPAAVNGLDTATPLYMDTNSIGWFGILQYPNDEQLKAIDDYFSRYGYAINAIISIDFHKRSKWDYIKTRDCQFPVEYAPVEAEEAIDKMFDEGLTIWHEYSTFGDYSQDND